MKTTLEIQNLKCGGCANTITTKLKSLDGISEIDVDADTNNVAFSYESLKNLEDAKALLLKIGYPVIGEKNDIATKAKSFVSCAVGLMNN